jgi:cobalt-zinc-cadmium efflux system membrane fusion protein
VIIGLAGITGAALLIWAVSGVSGVSEPKPPAGGATAQNDVSALDGKFIRFSSAFAQREGVSDVPVRLKELSPVVNVTGTVTTDTRKFVAVGARIGGRLRRIFKVVGDEVRAQEALAEIESAELGRTEAHVLAMRAKEMAAEAQQKRERRLADAKVASERDAELAQAEYEATRAERVAAEKAFAALGGDLHGEIGVLTLRSPMAGKIIASRVARGQTVAPTDTLFEVADLSTLWVQLSVFERDLPGVRIGDSVEIRAGVRSNGPLVGRVAHIGDVIDLSTRSAHVRVVIPGQGSDLRPGQSVEARIQLKAPGGSVPTVPRVAVTRIDGKPTVLVLTGPGVVEPREVRLGAEDNVDATVLDGLRENERVIAEGLFALKSELFR